MPLRPQSIGCREFRDVAQLQRHRSVDRGPDQFVNERDNECRDDQSRQDAAEEPGLRFGLSTSDPDQKRSAYREPRAPLGTTSPMFDAVMVRSKAVLHTPQDSLGPAASSDLAVNRADVRLHCVGAEKC
jgi:hypothetical protein